MIKQVSFKKPILSFQFFKENTKEIINELLEYDIKAIERDGKLLVDTHNESMSPYYTLEESDWLVLFPSKINNGSRIIAYKNKSYQKIYE